MKANFLLSCACLILAAGVTLPRSEASTEVAYFAGGCYWGVESVFDHVKGVKKAISGFATGTSDSGQVVWRRAGHDGIAETVRVEYDPAKVSYAQLLTIFFTVAHDPTQLDRQGPDVGARYRSSVFVTDSVQLAQARQFIDSLRADHRGRPIVTDLLFLGRFKRAAEPQQDFAEKNPDLPYIRTYDAPLMARLRARFPALTRS